MYAAHAILADYIIFEFIPSYLSFRWFCGHCCCFCCAFCTRSSHPTKAAAGEKLQNWRKKRNTHRAKASLCLCVFSSFSRVCVSVLRVVYLGDSIEGATNKHRTLTVSKQVYVSEWMSATEISSNVEGKTWKRTQQKKLKIKQHREKKNERKNTHNGKNPLKLWHLRSRVLQKHRTSHINECYQ